MLKRSDNRNQKFVMGYSAAYPMGSGAWSERGEGSDMNADYGDMIRCLNNAGVFI